MGCLEKRMPCEMSVRALVGTTRAMRSGCHSRAQKKTPAFSQEFVKEARAELERLRQERGRLSDSVRLLDLQIERLEGILGPGSQLPASEAPSANREGRSLSNLGMRDAIRAVLKESDRPMPRSRIQNEFETRGFVLTGTSTLTNRLTNELYRLARLNKVRRTARGFSLPLEEANGDGGGDGGAGGEDA